MSATATSVTVDPVAARAFLNVLYYGVSDGWVTINWRLSKAGSSTEGVGTECFPPDELDAMAWCMERHADTCVWHGVALRRDKLPWGKRGGVKDCTTITSLWADLDVDNLRVDHQGQPASGHSKNAELYPTLAAAYEALEQLPVEPSLVVESGGGLQPYWLLEEPHLLEGSDLLARWRATCANRLTLADAVVNADRIMRTPGSLNNKHGLVPVPVEIAKTNGDPPRRYTVAELLDVLDVPVRKPPPSSNGTSARTNGSTSWIDQVVADFNAHTNWADVLAGEFEYLETTDTGISYWHAVDAEHDKGASTNAKGTDRLVVYSETAGRRTGWKIIGEADPVYGATSYDRFSAAMLLAGAGDPIDDTAARTEFARKLRLEGYGPASDDFSWIDQNESADFWEHRPALGRIRDFARARRCSPWAVLGVALTRISVATPPFVVLPALVGSYASLNIYVGLVGPSGAGKDAAAAAARDAVDVGTVTTAGVGSGEGIAHQYCRYRKPSENDPGGLEQHTTAVLFTAHEVDTLGALKTRQSSTLLPELRKAWTGDELGFAYVDKEKRLRLPAHSYRLGLVTGIQPERAATLLDDTDSGTPQRFLWIPATDPHAPDVAPTEPDPIQWKPFRWPPATAGRVVVAVCDAAREMIDEARLARLRGDGDALDGHALLARLKTAAVLAILDQRAAVTDDDWALAGTIQKVSNATRQRVVETLAARQREVNHARGQAEAERSVIVAETLEDVAIKRVARAVQRKLGQEWMTRNELRKTLASRDREHFDAAVDRLAEAGQVEIEATNNQGPDGVRYRPTEAAT